MGGAIAMPMAASPQVAEMVRTKSSSKDSSQSDKRSESGVSDKGRHSWYPHMEQVEHLRGSLYPSHWMIPPNTAPFFHFGLGAPPVYPPSTLQNPNVIPHAIALQHAGHMTIPDARQSGENEVPARSSASMMSAMTAPTAPVAPPVTSIRPSAITTKHIEILRTRLKHLEDQLQYNKHQIDERAFQKDAQIIRQQIQQFEKNLEQQMLAEGQCPKSTKKNTAGKPEVDKSFKGFYYGHNATYGGAFSASADRFIDKPQYYNNPNKKSTPRVMHGSKTPNPNFDGFAPLSMPLDGSSTIKTEKSTLPAGAALAAPFQPRGASFTTQMPQSSDSVRRATTSSETTDNESPPTEMDFATGGRMDWGTVALTHVRQSDDAPYLVGHMPVSVQKHDDSKEYVYGRELTEDELRARHMYWGNTPRHLQKGLPKFNGKDFFPPSPVKADISEEMWTAKSPSHQTEPQSNGLAICVPEVPAHNDPFQGLGQSGPILSRNGPGNSTQSESLPGPQDVVTESIPTGPKRLGPSIGRVGRSLDGVNIASVDSTQGSPNATKAKVSSDKVEEGQELLFTGRRTMNRA